MYIYILLNSLHAIYVLYTYVYILLNNLYIYTNKFQFRHGRFRVRHRRHLLQRFQGSWLANEMVKTQKWRNRDSPLKFREISVYATFAKMDTEKQNSGGERGGV